MDRRVTASFEPQGDRPNPLARGVAFASIWATGPSPERDRVFRLSALKWSGGSWATFDAFCQPFGTEADEESRATKRMAQEFGVHGAELAGCSPAEESWPELRAFLGGLPVIVLDRRTLEGWGRALGGVHAGPTVGVAELAELLCPGRLASLGEGLVAELLGPRERAPSAIGPEELRAAAGSVVGTFLEQDPLFVAFAARALEEVALHLDVVDADAAATIELALGLAREPRSWSAGAEELFPRHPGLVEGRLEASMEAWPDLPACTRSAEPAWTWDDEDDSTPLPVEPRDAAEGEARLGREDERRIDEIFEAHLPRLFESDRPREGQTHVAREVARAFGDEELLLVHAPTGTGKTLAYIVPAMVWAARYGVRVGVATFTRALQEQAMDREVPLALELLRRAGFELAPRVAMLKGRNNYLCWRAIELHRPRVEDSALRRLAWTRLMLFALTDPDGDLDRLPRSTALPFARPGEVNSAIAALVRQCRAESGCCRRRTDRDTCAADVARRRAERSHVVITNHSYALARQGFFKYVVFDECEHLHDQAHSAWSHVLPLKAARDRLDALGAVGGSSRSRPLDRIRRAVVPGSSARLCLEECLDLVDLCHDAVGELEEAVGAFKGWRDRTLAAREEADEHSLFREYVQSEDSGELRHGHARLCSGWNRLAATLATLSEYLDELPLSGKPRVRRNLDLARADLEEFLQGLVAWIPYDEGRPRFRPETFYDLETDARDRDALAARVLLPHEYLGRYFFPELRMGVCLSATTHLKGGFEASASYLGLARAAEPAPEEDRAPSPFRTVLAPSPFDYTRVLVAVPRDAPVFRSGAKGAYLDYVCRFVRELGERTRGRMLVLFTNAADCTACGRELEPWFAERGIPLWYQRMEGAEKEELAERFRSRTDSILLGLDTFWYGADFPGETLEYLVIAKLPYGVPDRYHHAQCAAIGKSEQRRLIYMPRALAKFRQGFGRLMRKESDRGCVFVLDSRILDPRHRIFLKELPIEGGHERDANGNVARFLRGESERVHREALAHMGMLSDVELHEAERSRPRRSALPEDVVLDVSEGDVPY